MTDLLFFKAYLLVDMVCVVLTIIAASHISRNSGSEKQVRYFFFFLTAYLVFVVADAIWAFFMFSGIIWPDFVIVGIVTLIGRVAIATSGYYWFCYSLLRFESALFYKKRFRIITALPILLVLAMYVAGVVFRWGFLLPDVANEQGGIDYLVVSGISLFYLFAATIAAARRYRHAKNANQRSICTAFVLFMIAPALAAIINVGEPNLPVVAPGIMISILLVLLSLQESRIFSDELTGLNNRRRANVYLEESISHASSEHPIYLFIIDMNRLKMINDTYGHLEGDRALQLVAQALRASCKTLNAFAARWGGDEFIVVCTESRSTCTNPNLVVSIIDENLSKETEGMGLSYDLSCSVGFAECDSPDMTISELIANADKMLYSLKNSEKSA